MSLDKFFKRNKYNVDDVLITKNLKAVANTMTTERDKRTNFEKLLEGDLEWAITGEELGTLRSVIEGNKLTSDEIIKAMDKSNTSSSFNFKLEKAVHLKEARDMILAHKERVEDASDYKITAGVIEANVIEPVINPDKRVLTHEQILWQLHELYKKKNQDYGNSFEKSLDKSGLLAAYTRMGDKWNRFENASVNKVGMVVNDESVRDTLIDLANYAVMTVMWLDKGAEELDEQ